MAKQGNASLVREANALKRRVDQLSDDVDGFKEKIETVESEPVVKKPKKGDPPVEEGEGESEDDVRD